MKIAIIRSTFNPSIVDGLLSGALSVLEENQVSQDRIETFEAPGAYEIPLIAKMLAKTKKYDGIIALGNVIKGDTAHFEYISEACSQGLMQAMLDTKVPMSFGILTTYTRQQAISRSLLGSKHNKGREAALACLASIKQLSRIQSTKE